MDLPPIWEGHYRVSDSLPAGEPGVERALTLRFVRSDSSVVATPLLVIRVIAEPAWARLAADDAQARYGYIVGRDSTRLIVMRPAAENPLPAGTADALAFDSLMMAVLQRPMRAVLHH